MLLSAKMPHSGRDEEDYIEALETVRATLFEEKKAGAVDFFGLDSIEWYVMYGPECVGGGEDITTKDKKMRWLPKLKEFNCTVQALGRITKTIVSITLGGPGVLGSVRSNSNISWNRRICAPRRGT